MTTQRITEALQEAFCPHCGCGWFEIACEEMDPDQFVGTGGIKFSGDGRVLAYSGTVICFECGEPVTFPMASFVPTELKPEHIAVLDLPPVVTTDKEQNDSPSSAGQQTSGCEMKSRRAAPD